MTTPPIEPGREKCLVLSGWPVPPDRSIHSASPAVRVIVLKAASPIQP